MARANSTFVGFLSTSSPCQTVTGVSDGFAPNLSSKAWAASGSSSSSIQECGSRLRAAISLRRVPRVARAYYPQAHAGPHQVRTPRDKGLQDDVRKGRFLGDDLLQ